MDGIDSISAPSAGADVRRRMSPQADRHGRPRRGAEWSALPAFGAGTQDTITER